MKREQLVNTVRKIAFEHYTEDYARALKLIDPSCDNCEFNRGGTCAGKEFGKPITKGGLCLGWDASYSSWCAANWKLEHQEPRRRNARHRGNPCLFCEYSTEKGCSKTTLCDKF